MGSVETGGERQGTGFLMLQDDDSLGADKKWMPRNDVTPATTQLSSLANACAFAFITGSAGVKGRVANAVNPIIATATALAGGATREPSSSRPLAESL